MSSVYSCGVASESSSLVFSPPPVPTLSSSVPTSLPEDMSAAGLCSAALVFFQLFSVLMDFVDLRLWSGAEINGSIPGPGWSTTDVSLQPVAKLVCTATALR